MKNINYQEEIDKLCDALDVIAKFEDGDSLYLKRNIREEIKRLEEIDEKLAALSA